MNLGLCSSTDENPKSNYWGLYTREIQIWGSENLGELGYTLGFKLGEFGGRAHRANPRNTQVVYYFTIYTVKERRVQLGFEFYFNFLKYLYKYNFNSLK